MPLPQLVIIGEIVTPFLIRTGITKWVGWTAVTGLLARLTVSRVAVTAWFKSFTIWTSQASVGFILLREWIEDTLGINLTLDVSSWKESILGGVGELIAEELNDKLGTELTTVYPPNDPDVQADILTEIGLLIGKKINEQLGTNFTSVYPVENFKAELVAAVESDIIYGTERIISAPMLATLRQKVVNSSDTAFLALKGGSLPLPIANNTTNRDKLIIRRINNRARQKQYRINHPRLQVWVTPENQALVDAFYAQLLALEPAEPNP